MESDDEIPESEQVETYKTKYSTEKLMMLLDREKLEALEEEFNDHPDGIKLPNFVWLMKMAMNVNVEDKAELILGLWQLFDEIDINGDKHMEWSEFTQYIIDTVMGQNDKAPKDNREQTVAEILEQAKSHKSRRYQPSSLIDRSLHTGTIRQIQYLPSLDLVSVVEMGSKQVKLYTTDCEIKQSISPKFKDQNFVLSTAYNEKEKQFVIAASDKTMYVYVDDQTGGWRLANEFKVKETQIAVWYFERHKAWVSAGTDHLLRRWDIRTGNELMVYDAPPEREEKSIKPASQKSRGFTERDKSEVRRKNRGHNETIMDAVEIQFPMCVATAGLDGLILIWDLSQKNYTRRLDGQHSLGIRSLDYSPDHGGNLLSVGYEKHVNIWSPGISLSDQCFTGSLEGHNCPVVSCKFFVGRPVCVSVDEKGNVRLWDIRYHQCFQIITHERGKMEISKLITITKHDKFMIGGKRLFCFEPLREQTHNYTDDIIPLWADFNTYYLKLFILTKYDIRIYDAVTGKLVKIFTELMDANSSAELSSFTFDYRFRKFIIGDNAGGIRIYNCSNGALMNVVREPEVQQFQEDKNTEISDLKFCIEDKLLISSSWDSKLRIYDQQDPESTPRLRTLSGGHRGYDISCLAYSEHYSLVASGSTNGIVAIWDFEIGKLEAACMVQHDREICSLVFLDKQPYLLSSSHDHTVCVWAHRPLVGRGRYNCLMRFTNKTWFKNRDLSTTVMKMHLVSDTMEGIPTITRTKWNKTKIGDYEASMKKQKSTRHYSKMSTKLISMTTQPYVQFEIEEKNTPEEEESVLSDEVDYTGDADYIYVEQPGEQVDNHLDAQVKERMYIYIGDEKGWIKIWSADHIINTQEVCTYASERDRPSYNPYRKDKKDAENDLKYWTTHWKQQHREKKIVKRSNVEDGTLIKEWQGHNEAISSIVSMKDPQGLVSCSLDKTVKMWSRSGQLWGCIDLLSNFMPSSWNFPYNWEKKKQEDVAKVIKVMKKIDEEIDFDPNQLRTSITIRQQTRQRRRETKQHVIQKPNQSARRHEEEKKFEIKPGDYFNRQQDEEEDDDVEIERRPMFSKTLTGRTKQLSDRLDDIDIEHRKLEKKMKREQKEKETKIDANRLARRRNKFGPIPTTKENEEITPGHVKQSSRSSVASSLIGTIKQKSGMNSNLPSQNQINMVIEETYMAGPSPMAQIKGQNAASTPSLPKIEKKQERLATKAAQKTPQPKAMQKKHYTQSASNLNTGTEKRRPILGYSASRVPVNRFYLERLGNEISRVKMSNIKKKKEQPTDIRFRPGESTRMLNHIVAAQHLKSSADIAPYTEDIAGLQKKNKMLRTFSEDTFRNNLKTIKPKINFH